MAYGHGTVNKMDTPLKNVSVFAPYVGDNGFKWAGKNAIHILAFANGTTATYDEDSATAPFGTIGLAVPSETTLTLDYNKSMITRIQRTQEQDVPVANLAAKWAAQQISEVFIPEHDAYSLAKLSAARPVGNVIAAASANWETTKLSKKFEQAINKARVAGAKNTNQMLAWLSYDFAAELSSQINFTGSDAGYKDAKTGYLGKHKGVVCIEVPNEYLVSGTHVIVADKRAIINVTPKMSPEDYDVLNKISGFSGSEVQLRDRAGTYVLPKRARNIATIEETVPTTTTTAG